MNLMLPYRHPLMAAEVAAVVIGNRLPGHPGETPEARDVRHAQVREQLADYRAWLALAAEMIDAALAAARQVEAEMEAQAVGPTPDEPPEPDAPPLPPPPAPDHAGGKAAGFISQSIHG